MSETANEVMNVGTWLLRSAKRHPERIAVRHGDTILSWTELAQRSQSLANALIERGLEPGDRVAIVQPNGSHYIESLFGIFLAGCAAVPINYALHPKEATYIIRDAEASALIHGGSQSSALIELCQEMPNLKFQVTLESGMEALDYEDLVSTAVATFTPVAVTSTDPAWLFYTSGTTGKPKGVIWTHRMIRIMVMNYLADVYSLQPDDVVLHMAPMSHGSGTVGLSGIARGSETVILDTSSFIPERAYELVSCYGVTNIAFAAPTQIVKMLQAESLDSHDISTLKCICYGGAPMYVEDLRKALKRFGPIFVQIFGQGEAPMTISYLPAADHIDDEHPERLGSAGIARTDVEIKIDGADSQADVSEVTGNILVRGDIVTPGYWRNPEATAEAIKDGWLNTGDVGRIDEHGYLYIQDRSKDVVISGGNNIYPREVEEVILQLDGVLECTVFGIPDEYWGEALHAVVVLNDDIKLTEADIIDHCVNHLARYKKPKSVDFVSALPKSEYGKILKRELREPFWRGYERLVGGGVSAP